MRDELGEKTEMPTPKRRQEARENGQIAKSNDLAGALMLVTLTLLLALALVPMLAHLARLVELALSDSSVINISSNSLGWASMRTVFGGMVTVLVPALLIAWAVTYLSHFCQVGWLVAPAAVAPKLSKLNPLSGLKRIFSISSIVKASLDTGKVAIVVIITTLTITQMRERIIALPMLSSLQALGAIAWMVFDLSLRILALLLLLGIADYAYQRWKHTEDLKMTKQQVKDELKQSEGDPEVKKRRSQMQQQVAMQRVNTAVPQADVIVTNPEHISIAIKYEPEQMNAPKVVAKGADYLAMRIRQIAGSHDIPIVERKPLARALYQDVKVGQEVPAEFYKAVAEILAYVYRLSGKVAG